MVELPITAKIKRKELHIHSLQYVETPYIKLIWVIMLIGCTQNYMEILKSYCFKLKCLNIWTVGNIWTFKHLKKLSTKQLRNITFRTTAVHGPLHRDYLRNIVSSTSVARSTVHGSPPLLLELHLGISSFKRSLSTDAILALATFVLFTLRPVL